jgi:pimeloyl-ACP methyl ester carboxylesterase
VLDTVAAVSGPPVLLVHGFASSFERNWREPGWVDLLSDAGREVIGLDLLGHGRADKPYDPEAYANLHEDVRAALPADPSVAIDAIGFSLGGMLLLRVASENPERFNRLVIGGVGQNAFHDDIPGGADNPIASAIEDGPTDSTHGIARLFAQFAAGSGNDPKALAACLRRPQPGFSPADAARITAPVLVVLGDKDFAGPPEPLVDALADATLVTLKGLDHFGTPNAFGFIDAALDFLGAVPA